MLQVLTALELARQARIAANRAYLAGLGLGPNAVHGGQVAPLAPDDPVMLKVGVLGGVGGEAGVCMVGGWVVTWW